MISVIPFLIKNRLIIGATLLAIMVSLFFLHYRSVVREKYRLKAELTTANAVIVQLNTVIELRSENEKKRQNISKQVLDDDDGCLLHGVYARTIERLHNNGK